MPRITLIGAGSLSFGSMMLADLLRCPDLRGTRLALVDVDAAKLERMMGLARRLNQASEAGFDITSTTDRREALPGSDLVVVAVERKHYEMWRLDMGIPHKHGVKQYVGEVAGPGGMFHTFRQVPLILDIARDMERLCPNAWLINMSNPESRLTLAVQRYSHVKNVGVCLGAYITRRDLASLLGRRQEDLDIKAAGLNHCHWVLDVRDARTGQDLYPQIRSLASAPADRRTLMLECLRRFGYYAGPSDAHVGEFIGWGWRYVSPHCEDWIRTADESDKAQEAILEALGAGKAPLEDVCKLGIQSLLGMRWQTLDIMLSLLDNGNRYVLSLNVPNQGHITNLKQGAVVEIPATVGADRIYGLALGDLPPAIAALMDIQLRIQELVVEAAVTGDRQTALEALYIDPTVPDPQTADKVFEEMLSAQAEFLPQFQ